jgi:alginate O-acetyltransferase complex protein AlgI
MSLSAWLKEYLYVSLGGNRHGPVRTYVNLLIVMVLGGLWHGSDWKFAVWGLWHGALLVIERLLGIGEPGRGLIGMSLVLVRVPLTFVLVTIGWLFFRLTHLGDIILLFDEFRKPLRAVFSTTSGQADTLCIYLLSAIVLLFHLPVTFVPFRDRVDALTSAARPYTLGVLIAVILMASGGRHAFIYFQF